MHVVTPSQNSGNVTKHSRLHHSRVPHMICNIFTCCMLLMTQQLWPNGDVYIAFIQFFDIIEETHCRQKGHIGSKKTIQEVNILSLQVYAIGDF